MSESQWPMTLSIVDETGNGEPDEVYVVHSQGDVDTVLYNFVENILILDGGPNGVDSYADELQFEESVINEKMMNSFFDDFPYSYKLEKPRQIKRRKFIPVCEEEGKFFVGRDVKGTYLFFGKPIKTVQEDLFRVVGASNWSAPICPMIVDLNIGDIIPLNDTLYNEIFIHFCQEAAEGAKRLENIQRNDKNATLGNLQLIARETRVLKRLIENYKGE